MSSVMGLNFEMIRQVCLSLVFLAIVSLATSCTSQQIYGVGQAWQRNHCFKIDAAQERSRCLETANSPYGQYKESFGDSF